MDTTKKVKYVFSDEYNPHYINGAYGGAGSNEEVIIHFYQERFPVPRTSTLSIYNGVITEEFLTEGTDLIRYVQSGIVMKLETARMIHSWLGSILSIAERGDNDADDI